jgi:branched-chain amino acid aminotransferase
MSILIENKAASAIPETRSLPFGKIPTDHMFIAEYRAGGWHDARIVPFADLTMSPLALCLHYGQTVFEGMKAFPMADGKVNVFRPEKHYDRFCKSLDRLCMPAMPYELFLDAVAGLVDLDRNWVPTDADGSLYLRPFMIATEARVGVKVSDEYLFMVVATPAYAYYTEPLRVKIETTFARAAAGGTGYAKCGGNYGGAFYPTQKAREEGFDQVIWTDSKTHSYIEESGTMNLMFYWNGKLVTPPLSGTILDGITRDSLLAIAQELGIEVEVRPVEWSELETALIAGERLEAFGAGTAAVIAPIRTINITGEDYTCYTGEDAVMYKLSTALAAIRRGEAPDNHGWNHVI